MGENYNFKTDSQKKYLSNSQQQTTMALSLDKRKGKGQLDIHITSQLDVSDLRNTYTFDRNVDHSSFDHSKKQKPINHSSFLNIIGDSPVKSSRPTDPADNLDHHRNVTVDLDSCSGAD
jgi:hypothetical protein